ncbi:HP1 family phage holin [Escherichia coli]|uniref:HP1 family phage holin n=1 Tax=Escherichia coli TaxID=562 RepID=UPI001E621895|nr:HP1 family phage holin [Escherichia coli]MCD9181525.1 phage holin family protein [Escherichia coli]
MYRMDKIREWFSYSFGGLTAMGGILSLNDWAVIIGILCTVGTFGINWLDWPPESPDNQYHLNK